jgi:hypothetical protein
MPKPTLLFSFISRHKPQNGNAGQHKPELHKLIIVVKPSDTCPNPPGNLLNQQKPLKTIIRTKTTVNPSSALMIAQPSRFLRGPKWLKITGLIQTAKSTMPLNKATHACRTGHSR